MATTGPSVASDIYTIGRTLAVLTTDFRGYQSTYQYSLPDRDQFPAYRDVESFYRLILRATSTEPADRFVDAAEMSEQMLGVLRQVLSADGEPRPAVSRLFTGEQRTDPQADAPLWRDLPGPLIDLDDPAAAFLASIAVTDPAEVLALLASAPQDTPEVRLRGLRAHIELGAASGSFDAARRARDELNATGGADWRLAWYDGLLALATGEYPAARARFDVVYSGLPGELAPQLALALSLELAGERATAAGYYDVVSRTDRAFTTAAAGLARCRLAAGDRTGAVEAYNRVPGTSAAYTGSQIGAIRALVRPYKNTPGSGTPAAPPAVTPSAPAPASESATVDVAALAAAAALIDRLELDSGQLAALRAELLEQVLSVLAGGVAVPVAVLGARGEGHADERSVRFALEGAYREMARSAHGPDKIRLVDLANASRPRTRT
jgi:serine/threonine-protein kinase PknG